MIKVCMVSNTKTGGACGGSTCQWAYRVSSSSRHRSCRIFSAHTHAHQEHFGEAGEKALHTVWRRCGLAEFCFVCYILSKIILYVCVKKLSDSLLYKRLQRHVSVQCVSMRVHALVWMCEFLYTCCLLLKCIFFFSTGPMKGRDWMPSFCRAIAHSHPSFLHVRFTLQTLLVTLPHPHQRLPPERLSGILAEIYSPHLYASETC